MDRRNALKAMGAGAVALGGGMIAGAAHGQMVEGGMAGGMAGPESEGYKDGEFVLPPLPYDYNALEPHIDEQTMRLHHDKHHQGYVNGANAALKALAAIRDGSGEAGLIKHWERELAFNGSGHVLHTIFWRNMSPKPGGPSDAFSKAAEASLGGVDKLKMQFSAAAKSVEGSGWGILGYCPLSGGLVVLQAEKHQNLTMQGVIPLLVCDVWEHAYYLKYQNNRGAYVDAFWNVVDWADVSKRYAAAMK